MTRAFAGKIEDVSDERALGHGYIVTLRPGWSFEHSCHEGVQGFDTKREYISAVRDASPCLDCPECDEYRAQGGTA